MSGFWRAGVEVAALGYEWKELTAEDFPPGWDVNSIIPSGRISLGVVGQPYAVPPQGYTDFGWYYGRLYDPLAEDAAMFWRFAKLEPTQDAVLAFANRHGLLWRLERSSDRPGRPFSLFDWEDAIEDFRDLLELWIAIKEEDDATIRKHTRWWSNDGFAGRRGRQLATNKPQPSFLPANGVLGAEDLNLFLAEQCSGISVRAVPANDDGPGSLVPQVDELIDAMWIQFATAVMEDREFRQCEVCEEHFEISPGLNRVDRLTCSSPCRQKAYRRRQKQARAMRAEGAHLRTIAKATGADMQTIKKWVGED